MGFHGEALLAPRPNLKLEDHPLSAVRDCLFNIFAATLHIGGRSSIRNLRTRHVVVTGTHLSHGTAYHKYPKSAVTTELKCWGLQKWRSEWDNTSKGALTKTFFPTIKDRLTKRLPMNVNLSTVVTGHGKFFLTPLLYHLSITDYKYTS